MLKQRLITAFGLITLVLIGLFLLPASYFHFLAGGVVLLAAWEWAYLSGFKARHQQAIYTALIFVCLAYFFCYPAWRGVVLIAGLAWWLLAVLVLAAYLFNFFTLEEKQRSSFLILGVVFLNAFWIGLYYLREASPWAVVNLLLVVYTADSAAYFGGKRYGKRRLAPRLSPGKTVVGCYFGMGAALMVGIIQASLMRFDYFAAASYLSLIFVVVVISIIGDLFESMAKRLQQVKDSSQLLPGHGGVLDRLDSLIAATPLFTMVFAFILHIAHKAA